MGLSTDGRILLGGAGGERWALELPTGALSRAPAGPSFPLAAEGAGPDLSLELRVRAAIGDRPQAALWARAGEDAVELTRLAPPRGALALGKVWRIGAWALVSLERERGRALLRVDLARARARLADARAWRAHARGDAPAAIAAWQAALELDPRDGDAAYNLACAHALAGALELAARELELAIALDPPRYRLLGRHDPDLAELRERPEIARLLRVPR